MRNNDRVTIKLGPARYDSDKAVRDKITDAIDEAANDAYNAIVNNPDLDLAGGGAAAPTPGTFPVYSAPSLATGYPVDGQSLTSKIYSERPYLTALDTVGNVGLGDDCIFGQQVDNQGGSDPTVTAFRGFNATTGTMSVLAAGGAPGGSSSAPTGNFAAFAHGDYLYSYGYRWSLGTGWQSFQSNDTYGPTARTFVERFQIAGVSNGYIWIALFDDAYVTNFSGATYGIWAIDKSGNVNKAYSLPSLRSMRGVKVENGTVWFTYTQSSGVETTFTSPAVVPLIPTQVTVPASSDHLDDQSHQTRGIDSSGNIYYFDYDGSSIQRLNVMGLTGTKTQYPNVFSTTGDPLDGDMTESYTYSSGLFASSLPKWVSVIYGRIFAGGGIAGDYLGETYPERVYPAIYEVALSGGSSTASVLHASIDPSYPAPPAGYSDIANYGFTMGPFLLDGGEVVWMDNAYLHQRITTPSTINRYTNDLAQIYRAAV